MPQKKVSFQFTEPPHTNKVMKWLRGFRNTRYGLGFKYGDSLLGLELEKVITPKKFANVFKEGEHILFIGLHSTNRWETKKLITELEKGSLLVITELEKWGLLGNESNIQGLVVDTTNARLAQFLIKKYRFKAIPARFSDRALTRLKYATGALLHGYPKKHLFGKARRLVLRLE